jgi:hypothetical protein
LNKVIHVSSLRENIAEEPENPSAFSLDHNGFINDRAFHRTVAQHVLTIIAKLFPHGHNNGT